MVWSVRAVARGSVVLSMMAIFCVMADPKTSEERLTAVPQVADPLRALENSDLTDLLGDELDETFLEAPNTIAARNRHLQQDPGAASSSPTPSFSDGSRGFEEMTFAPTMPPASSIDRGIEFITAGPSATPTEAPSSAAIDRGVGTMSPTASPTALSADEDTRDVSIASALGGSTLGVFAAVLTAMAVTVGAAGSALVHL